MRPALYYPWVYLKGGAERMLLELMRRSRHNWTLYTNRFEPDSTYPEFADLDVVTLGRVSLRRTPAHVALNGLRLMTQQLDLSSHGSLFVVSEGLGNLVALRSAIPTSCICLTPLKVAYDKVTRERFYRMHGKFHYRLPIALYKRFERRAWAHYGRVFCSSQEVRRRLLEAQLVEPERLEVVHHGVDCDRFQPTGERDPYFLVPGRMMWQKNLELAIQAWLDFKPSAGENPFRLVIAGMVDFKSRPYVARLRSLAAGRPDIVFVESPPDAALLGLYQACHAVVFTPPNEDWGLVPLEAMACGKPVLATDRGGPRETVVDGETGYLRADEPGAFAAGIRQLAAMPATRLDALAAAARDRATQFRWDKFVARMDIEAEVDASSARLRSSLFRRTA